MTSIEKEFKSNKDQFIIKGYKHDMVMFEMLNDTDVLAFNIWSMLKKAEPPLDGVFIECVTEEEAKAWEEEAERLTNE